VGEGANDIAERLRSSRYEVRSHLRQFGTNANTQWRGYYERNPWIFVAAAFAGGLLLSTAIRGRRRSEASGRHRRDAPIAAERDAHMSEVWDRIKATLLTAAGSQITSFVREIVPSLLGRYQSLRSAGASDTRSPNGSGGGGNGRTTDKSVYQ
jgi:hypothetical protein